jgi:hypothetical protein
MVVVVVTAALGSMGCAGGVAIWSGGRGAWGGGEVEDPATAVVGGIRGSKWEGGILAFFAGDGY